MYLRDPKFRKYDLTSIQSRRDPFPVWRQMQADGEVVPSKILILGKCWFATTWDSVNEVLRNQKAFCRNPKNAGLNGIPGMRWWMPRMFLPLAQNMIAYDGENHRRVRSLVDQAFMRQQVEAMRETINALIDRLLDDLETREANDDSRRSVNFVEGFARKLPLAVITEVLGLPDSDRPKFTKWFRGFSEFRRPWDLLKVFSGIKNVLRYLKEQFEIVRKNPRPGLITELVQIEDQGDRLTDNELLSTVFLLLVAGHETTVHLLSNSIVALENHPDQKSKLISDLSKAPAAVAEVLRYMSPVQIAKSRYVVQDIEFHGKLLQRGEQVVPILAAANIDPKKFDRPTVFDIDRKNRSHVTYGAGVHVCLGMKLANLEAELALEKLYTRFPNLVLHDRQIKWAQRIGMRSIKDLPVTLNGTV